MDFMNQVDPSPTPDPEQVGTGWYSPGTGQEQDGTG